MQADLVGSLQARLDILMAEAEQDGQTTESDSQPSWLSSSPGLSASSIQLPLRVFFPAKVRICNDGTYVLWVSETENALDTSC